MGELSLQDLKEGGPVAVMQGLAIAYAKLCHTCVSKERV